MMWFIVGICAALGIAVFSVVKLFQKNSKLKNELAMEHEVNRRMTEANKDYAKKLDSLSKGSDVDRFNAASSIMSDGKTKPTS